MADSAEHTPTGMSFRERLNFLFATVRVPGGGREYSNREVAQATGMSDTYIGYLRTGARDNPTRDVMTHLAAFFGVRPSLFLDGDVDDARLDSVRTQLELARALADPNIQQLALRASAANLSPQALKALTAMIEHVRQVDKPDDAART